MKNGRVHRVSRWAARLLGFVLVLILFRCAHAQTVPTYRPVAIDGASATSTGLSVRYQFAANDGTYTTEAVSIADSTIGGLALDAIKGGLGYILANAAFNAILKGVGDFIDEATNEVMSTSSSPAVTCSGTVYSASGFLGCSDEGAAYQYAESDAAANANDYGCSSGDIVVESVSLDRQPYPNVQVWDYTLLNSGTCSAFGGSGGVDNNSVDVTETTTTSTVSQPAYSLTAPASASDVGRAVVESNDPTLWQSVLSNPNNGAPVETPEVVAAEDALQQQAAAKIQAQTGTSPSYTPETGVNSDTTTNAAPNPDPTQQPTGCALNPENCEIRDFMKQPFTAPSDPTLPTTDVSQPASWDSGFGGGTCPAPIVVTVFGSTIDIPFTQACTFATDIRPLVIAAAFLASAFIMIGAGKKG